MGRRVGSGSAARRREAGGMPADSILSIDPKLLGVNTYNDFQHRFFSSVEENGLDARYFLVECRSCGEITEIQDVMVISWLTNVLCQCQVYYCDEEDLCRWYPPEPEFSYLHQFAIPNYRSWYRYAIQIEDELGNQVIYPLDFTDTELDFHNGVY